MGMLADFTQCQLLKTHSQRKEDAQAFLEYSEIKYQLITGGPYGFILLDSEGFLDACTP